jgi:LruC domain-containing protein
MKKSIWLFCVVSLWACTKQIEEPVPSINPQTMAELQVADHFNYATSQAMSGAITVRDLEDQSIAGVRVEIYDALPEEGGQRLSAGITDANGTYTPFGVLPAHLEHVVVMCYAAGFPNVAQVPASQGAVSFAFGGSNHKASNKTNKTSTTTTQISAAGDNCYYLSTYNSQGVPNNFLTPNDNIDQPFLNMVNTSLPERAPVPTANPQYLANGNSTDIKVLQPSDLWVTFVHEGAGYRNAMGYYVYNTSTPPTTVNDIDSIFLLLPNASFSGSGGGLYSGNKLHLGQFGPNTSVGWVLFQNAWDGSGVNVNRQRFYSNPDFNPESTALMRQHNVQLFDNARDLILIGFEDLHRDKGSDEDFNDLIFYITANPITAVETINIPRTTETATDSDNDGVIDNSDDYPNDPSKAFNNYAFGSLAFEDMWPLRGDYDFNDLVVGYNINQVANGNGDIVQVDMDLEVRAVGAAYTNGLAFAFENLSPADIASVTGQHFSNGSGSATESGQTTAVVCAFDDVYDFLNRPTGAFFNTLSFKPKEQTDTVHLSIVFTTPRAPQNLGMAPFNAFIVPGGFSSGQTRYEVHLPGYAPTNLADAQVFGQYDDRTNAGNGIFYKTDNNLPWAMNVASTDYSHVIEYTPILNAYLKFASWAQSSGGSFNDWYIDKSGYRDHTKIKN